MSDDFDLEAELNQDPVDQKLVDAPETDVTEMGAAELDSSDVADDSDTEEKQGIVSSFLNMGIFNAMLLLSLIFIFLATLNLLGVLRTYNGSFPFGGGYPWSTNI